MVLQGEHASFNLVTNSEFTQCVSLMHTLCPQAHCGTAHHQTSYLLFCRGQSKYRGVTRHHKQGKWEARIGRVKGSKYLYLGTYPSQEEAARAYDEAALKYRGEKVMLADLLLAAAILQ